MGARGRYGFWFPLALLGFLSLGGIVLTSQQAPLRGLATSEQFLTGGGMYGVGFSSSTQYTGLLSSVKFMTARSELPWEYWIVGSVVAFLATVIWYAWKSGREVAFAFAGVGGLIAVVGFLAVIQIVVAQPGLTLTVGGSLVALGLCAAAWVYFNLGRGGRIVKAISAVTLATGGSALLVNVVPVVTDEWIVVSGLLVLAWLERSLFLVAVAVAFFVVAWAFLPGVTGLVLMAAVLFFGAIAALLLRRAGAVAT
jgi:hypothetical protein